MCLEDFDEKRTLLLDANERRHKKNTHASLKDVFHFDSLRFADDGFCAQKDRRELARVQVRLRANTLVLLRVISSFWVAFFFSFFNIFSPTLRNREEEALWMWSLSSRVHRSIRGIDWSEASSNRVARKTTLLAENEEGGEGLVFFGRTLLLV